MRNNKKAHSRAHTQTHSTHSIHERQPSHGREWIPKPETLQWFFCCSFEKQKNKIETHHCVYFHIYTLYIVVRLNTYANAKHDRKTDSNYKRFVWFDMRSSIVWVLDNARLFPRRTNLNRMEYGIMADIPLTIRFAADEYIACVCACVYVLIWYVHSYIYAYTIRS